MILSFNILKDNAATICAWSGIACLTVWPMFRTRALMLLLQLAGLFGVSLHYSLVGATTAAVVNTLGIVQIVGSLLIQSRLTQYRTGYILAAIMVGSSIFTWQGIVSGLSTSGMLLVTVGRSQANANLMRALVLAGQPFFLANDLIIQSPLAASDALCLILGIGTSAYQCFRRSSNGQIKAGIR